MPDSQLPSSSPDDLQFTTAEPVNSAASTETSQLCVLCNQSIGSTYYAIEDKVVCAACAARAAEPPTGSRFGRLVKASLLGLGAGAIGTIIWFTIRRATGYEIGLVAILVGFMVGGAVRKGSAGKGGLGYQLLAVAITYCCIAANYMPDILQAAIQASRDGKSTVESDVNPDALPGDESTDAQEANGNAGAGEAKSAAKPDPAPPIGTFEAIAAVAFLLAIVFAISMAAPFLVGMQNLMGLLIIGFALWEAWKLNARRPLAISGPYQMGPRPTV